MDHVGMVNLELSILATKRWNMYETLVCEINPVARGFSLANRLLSCQWAGFGVLVALNRKHERGTPFSCMPVKS